MLPKLEPDVLSMGVGLGVGVGVGVGEDSMDAGGPSSVGSTEAQPVLSNAQTPVSTKKVGFTVTILFLFFFHSYQLLSHVIFCLFYFSFYLEKYASIHTSFCSLHRLKTPFVLIIDRQFDVTSVKRCKGNMLVYMNTVTL